MHSGLCPRTCLPTPTRSPGLGRVSEDGPAAVLSAGRWHGAPWTSQWETLPPPSYRGTATPSLHPAPLEKGKRLHPWQEATGLEIRENFSWHWGA